MVALLGTSCINYKFCLSIFYLNHNDLQFYIYEVLFSKEEQEPFMLTGCYLVVTETISRYGPHIEEL